MKGSMDFGPLATPKEIAFRKRIAEVNGIVLELGTMRWDESRPTHHVDWLHPDASHVRGDMLDGLDVDIVVDAHDMVDTFRGLSFDGAIAIAVWEHLHQPWVAADQLAAVCAPGAPIFISTHQTFPIHGYPDDYFRFSDRALASLFDNPYWDEVDARLCHPCQIIPPSTVTRWDPAAPAYLCVELTATRSHTPWEA
jgi:hypothetical protein